MDSKSLALLCRKLAENRKAEEVVILDMRKVSTIADYFVIATGSSDPHLRAIGEEITTRLKQDEGLSPRAVDGSFQASWRVLDYFDVIVHIMKPEARNHYDLESLWGDAPHVRPHARPLGTKKKAV